MIVLQSKSVDVVMRSCFVKISAVFEAILVIWLAVSICKTVVLGSSVSNLVYNEAISVEWVAVSDCKAVVFGLLCLILYLMKSIQ